MITRVKIEGHKYFPQVKYNNEYVTIVDSGDGYFHLTPYNPNMYYVSSKMLAEAICAGYLYYK